MNLCKWLCTANGRLKLCMFTHLNKKTWQPSALLNYSDMIHAMSTTSDGCSSFNCMSALNDGILNSYTFHSIAFHTNRGVGGQLRLSVTIWRGKQSPGWVIPASSLHQTACYTLPKLLCVNEAASLDPDTHAPEKYFLAIVHAYIHQGPLTHYTYCIKDNECTQICP